MSMPDYEMEAALGDLVVAGVDEVGRGPLAGPVVAAAVILDPARIPEGLNDSKKVPPLRREVLYATLMTCAEIGVGAASVAEIDELNILRASHLAMRRAVEALPRRPGHVLVDGNLIPRDFPWPATAVIKGDAVSQSIAAASIVAKIRRDRIMWDLAQHYPGYGWETNMGYPSKSHRLALTNLGVTPHHRRSFKPVHNILYQE
ncbi:ribonuclease HII [Thalassococcus sp. BH17M4-6]|uniref:ribonuclease HII n=1 Tax=Thalassococcus sp. BH17M4-6 TaxID=3413148 RepID=UPI003BE4DCC0